MKRPGPNQAALPELEAEDRDTADLIHRIQAGEAQAFSILYSRYFDRVYSYLRLVLRNGHDAEDATQQIFLKVLEALPAYTQRAQPFRAWLFTVVRNHAIDHLRQAHSLQLIEPDDLDRRRERPISDLDALNWLTDADILLFVERLPLPQRQVLLLRFMLDLPIRQTAAILGRTPADIKILQHRGLRFLKKRLISIGREPTTTPRTPAQRLPAPKSVIRRRRFSLHP